MTGTSPKFARSIFINCPFDQQYQAMFLAIVYGVQDAGFIPRCAREAYDSGDVRISKITRIIGECQLSIHDISRTDLDPVHGLPRFNMPLELGIDLGCRAFGLGKLRSKKCLIFDSEAYRYQKFISDIAGQDPTAHDGDPKVAIAKISNWLRTDTSFTPIPGGRLLNQRCEQFTIDLPRLCAQIKVEVDELLFADYTRLVYEWLKANPI